MKPRFSFRIGDLIAEGRFKVEEPINSGAHGEVYRVRDFTSGDDQIALKALRLKWTIDDEIVQRFVEEFTIMKGFSHSGVPKAYELIHDEKANLFISFKFVPGVTLSAAIQENKLSFTEKAFILFQLADILQYVHSRGIVHRDIKADNVILGDDLHVSLTDFGVSRIMASQNGVTETGESLGTLVYMSPETFNKAKYADYKADIFSLGVLAYHLFTGKLPYEGERDEEIMLKMLREPFPSLQATSMQIPQWCETFVARATEKDPEKRYSSALEVKELFARHLIGEADNFHHSELIRIHNQIREQKRESTRKWTKIAVGSSGIAATLALSGFPWL